MPWQRTIVYFEREKRADSLSATAILRAWGLLAFGLVACLAQPYAQSTPLQGAPPPTVWANPMHGGPIAVLFIGPEEAAADFEHLELRLQLKASRLTFTLAAETGDT